MTTGVEHVDETVARAGDIVVLLLILQGVGDINLSVNILNTKRSKSSRKIRIGEAVRVGLLEILVISLDVAGMKICYEEKIVATGDAQGGAFVNGFVCPAVLPVIDRNNRVRAIDVWFP